MTTTYSIEEIFTFAIKIEEHGMAFYEAMAKKTKNKDARELYLYLQEEEIKHRDTYAQLLKETVNDTTRATRSDDYSEYLRALVNTVVFHGDTPAFENDLAVVDYAIEREKDSILFYIEIKDHVPEAHRSLVNSIIDEERTHIIKLLDIKEKVN